MFTSWLTIGIAGGVMLFCISTLRGSSRLRKLHPMNMIILTVLTIAQAMFVGGLCSHSFISAVFLAGIFVSTSSHAFAAGYTWVSGKSRRLKTNVHRFVIIGFIIYIGIFVLLWDYLDHSHSLTYREFFFWAWIGSYLPFSYYFPYALVLFVLPEQADKSDVILAVLDLWLKFPSLLFRVATHWKEKAFDMKVHHEYEF